jgi:hypothetical protein
MFAIYKKWPRGRQSSRLGIYLESVRTSRMGRIDRIAPTLNPPPGATVEESEGEIALPGLPRPLNWLRSVAPLIVALRSARLEALYEGDRLSRHAQPAWL